VDRGLVAGVSCARDLDEVVDCVERVCEVLLDGIRSQDDERASAVDRSLERCVCFCIQGRIGGPKTRLMA
jgi:hypothetical protein